MTRPKPGTLVDVNVGSDTNPDWRVGVVLHQGRNVGGIYTRVLIDDESEPSEVHPCRVQKHTYIRSFGDDDVPASECCGECGHSRNEHDDM